jgi:hypothetical protein
MTQALVAFRALIKFYSHFGAGFIVGCIYVAILMTIPTALQAAARLL